MSPEDLNNWKITLAQIPLDLKLTSLPLDMPWEDFEKLCLKLVGEESNFDNIEITSAMLYGRNGQRQEGIDVKATIPNSSKFFVMQCKRYKRITVPDIDKWIKNFLKGKFSSQTYMYVLATNFDVSSDTKLVDSWHEAQQKLDSLGIKSALWDRNTILAKLKNAYNITRIFWGEQIATRYCHHDLSGDKYPYSYPIKNINVLDNFIYIENRTCHLDLMLPSTSSGVKVGGIFSFARKDLHGTTFSINGNALIPMLQVKAHSRSLRETTYLNQSGGKYYLSLENIRLSLDEEEVDDLDWILDQAFNQYLDFSKKVESEFNAIRFERNKVNFKIKLWEINKSLWNAIISYANTHDINNGDGAEFVFDAAPGALKVFSKQNSTDLDFGYHLILYPGSSYSIGSNNVILYWEPLNDIVGNPVEISPRKAWDAEYTYQWLHSYLFPNVYNWWINQEKNLEHWFIRIFKRNRVSHPPPLDYFVISSYQHGSRHFAQGARNLDDVFSYIDKLQRHFTSYQNSAKIDKQLILSVINSCILLLNNDTEYSSDYIRGNLRLGSGPVLKELMELKENQDLRIYETSTMLDMALRSLKKLLEVQSKLSQYEIDSLFSQLTSVLIRYEEDRICMTYY